MEVLVLEQCYLPLIVEALAVLVEGPRVVEEEELELHFVGCPT